MVDFNAPSKYPGIVGRSSLREALLGRARRRRSVVDVESALVLVEKGRRWEDVVAASARRKVGVRVNA